MVDLYIGKEKKHQRVHKGLLCQKIPYFAKMFQGGFKEATENTATFPEDSPESFGLLVEWIYTGIVRPLVTISDNNTNNYSVRDFYALAETLCLTVLKDTTLSGFQKFELNNRLMMDVEFLRQRWKASAEGSGLRLYTIDSLDYIFQALTTKNDLKIWPTAELMGLGKDSPGLLLAAFEKIRQHIHAGTSPKDPRQAVCDYHSHDKDEECTVKKTP